MRIMFPFSRSGSNESCCSLLNLWISSRKSKVAFHSRALLCSACEESCLISEVEALVALRYS